jgi:hypothetical protein
MDVEKWSSVGSRLCFTAALVLFTVAIVAYFFALFRVQLLFGYVPGRLVEFAAMFLIPVITVLLRQIREELRKQKHA